MNNKHGIQSTTNKAYTSNPHPYVHPYLGNSNQQTNGPRAPTTVSVPPVREKVQRGDVRPINILSSINYFYKEPSRRKIHRSYIMLRGQELPL